METTTLRIHLRPDAGAAGRSLRRLVFRGHGPRDLSIFAISGPSDWNGDQLVLAPIPVGPGQVLRPSGNRFLEGVLWADVWISVADVDAGPDGATTVTIP